MKKYTKLIIFFLAAAVNVVFFLLCGYGKVQMPNTSNLLDPLLGIIAVAALAFGEMRLITQLYFRGKYREMRIRTFDFKFLRQCFAIVAYYVGTLAYLAMATTIYKAGYISVFAIALCPLWMIGGRTLWTGETGEESYYLDDTAKWYVVSNVMENDDVLEIKCKAPNDRERTISIAKKNQQLDQ